MLRLPPTDAGRSIVEGWCKGCKVGLVLEFDGAIAGNLVVWCIHRGAAVTQALLDGFISLGLEKKERDVLDNRFDAIMVVC